MEVHNCFADIFLFASLLIEEYWLVTFGTLSSGLSRFNIKARIKVIVHATKSTFRFAIIISAFENQ